MMKKLQQLAFLLLISQTLFAGHFKGGEIYWECLNNGKYIFRMNSYWDCGGISPTYQNHSLSISGIPLPANLSSITMYPDLAKYQRINSGIIDPECNTNYGNSISCNNNDGSSLRILSYKSNPVDLIGTPPSSGWHFSAVFACCNRSGNLPINSSNQFVLQASMYSTAPVNFCDNNSPRFVEEIIPIFPSEHLVRFNSFAIDYEGDSLKYGSTPIMNAGATGGSFVTYASGYSATSPTPSTAFNSQNSNFTLDSETGEITFKVNGFNYNNEYAINTKVTSYTDGQISAVINRTLYVDIARNDTLSNGRNNVAPEMAPVNVLDPSTPFSVNVVAGIMVNIPISITDTNNNGLGNGIQELTVIPVGGSLSKNLIDSTNCPNPNDTNCAVLSLAGMLDSSIAVPKYLYKSFGNLVTSMSWQTDCDDLNSNGTAKTHYFLFKSTDDHCPVPSSEYRVISITVLPSAACNTITFLDEKDLKQTAKLYPNPTTEEFYLSGLEIGDKYQITIRNLQGKLVQENEMQYASNMRFSLDGKAGIYFVQLTNEAGERANFKVMKQ